MSELKYKTRGMSTYRGKANVFFLSHPDDFELYFETVSDEILEKQNAVIWYEEPAFYQQEAGQYMNDKEEKEHFENLAEMQLVVLAISWKFIHMGNEKMDADIAFALEHHIPILPIIQESGLEKAFDKKYGNLHMLDKNDKDPVAISYDEKLEQYLELVLIGNELADRVRNVFRGYIFLSYRKMDRKFVKEFMNLIHESEEDKDIGIWYDDFLLPGENFDDSIKNAINKSDVFAMLVTPNVMEKDNYVMKNEYPEAIKLEKPIVPVIFEHTDKDELEENYLNIPQSVGAKAEQIAEAIEMTIARRSKEEKGAEYFYLMGLAYLYGIDVEKNNEYARALLTIAINMGMPEATQKMVAIWYDGIGVERDLDTAISYQKLLVKQRKQLYYESETIENASEYVRETVFMADMLRENGRLLFAQTLYEEILEFQEDTLSIHGLMSTDYRKACVGIAVICVKNGDVERAKGYFELACRCSERFFNHSGNNIFRILQIKDLSFLSSMCKLQKDYSGAREKLLKAVAIAEELLAIEEKPEVQYLWAQYMAELGSICIILGENENADEYLIKALPVAKKAAEELKSQEAYYTLIGCYRYLGLNAAEKGLILKAGNYYLEIMEICRGLIKVTDDARAYESMAICYMDMGMNLNKGIVHTSSLEEALKIYDMLISKYPEDAEYKKSSEIIRSVLNGSGKW